MEYGEQEDEEIEEDEEEEDGTEEDEENEECANDDDKPWDQMHYKCKHAVENSSRFSLRVMEAMRFLQQHENVLPISCVKDIVDYITKNYNNDGDLYAQVRTALKQLCTHGSVSTFVVEVLKDEYQLIGPFGPSAMLETCTCEVDRNNSEIYSNTSKHTQLRRKLSKKCKKKTRCHCEKLQDEQKLGIKREESIFSDKDIALSRTDSLNNTMFVTPKQRVLRPRVRDNNVKMHSTTENITKRKRSAHNIRDDNGNKSREHTPKRIRKTNNDVAEASRNIEHYKNENLTPTDQINENPRNNIFQGIRNFFPTRSKTREKELKKWIQRCSREYEQQKKNNK